MSFDNNYFSADHNEYSARPLTKAGRGILRLVLLFGSAVVALALIVVPVLNDQANKVAAQSVLPDGIDRTMTGSIKRSPKPVCVIEANGSHRGDC